MGRMAQQITDLQQQIASLLAIQRGDFSHLNKIMSCY
jgi:hypothetical protein